MHEQQKVATEVAEQEFERFIEAMDLDIDTSRMDVDDTRSFEEAKHIIVRAMERGSLVVDENGQPVYTLSGGERITFYEPTGATFMAMDNKKRGQDVAKLVAIMADMTRQPAATFSKLPNRDFKVCRTLVTLFLG